MKKQGNVWIGSPSRVWVAAWVLAGMAGAQAAPQWELPQGVFFEAEDYAAHLRGGSKFAVPTDVSEASGGKTLIGMFNEGMIRYDLTIPAARKYTLWTRCAVPNNATAKFGFGGGGVQLQGAPLVRTSDRTGDAGTYRWQRVGEADLAAGRAEMFIATAGVRYDCFLLATDHKEKIGDAILEEVERVRQAPRGKLLPELVHTRAITQRPRWLLENALRPAYGHFEWDPSNTPQSWAKRAREAGANCLFGVGEMPAGTLNGKLHRIPFEKMIEPNFRYPEGYSKDDHSWVGEMVKAGHAEGLKVVIYDAAYRNLDPLLVEHPEWRLKNSKGQAYKTGFGSWFSPYRQAYIDRWVKVARCPGFS
jgi:hypothetical protein